MLNYDIHLQIIHLTGNYFIVRSQVAVHKNGSHSQHYVNSQNPLLCANHILYQSTTSKTLLGIVTPAIHEK